MTWTSIPQRMALTRAVVATIGALMLPATPGLAQSLPAPPAHDHATAPPAHSVSADMPGDSPSPAGAAAMEMGGMQGGSAPEGARDPNAFADGFEYTGMAGFEKTDQIPLGLALIDELEFVSGDAGDGMAWSAQFFHGGDNDKLLLRTQGSKVSGSKLEANSDLEAMWWHAYSPFWGRVAGVRRDIGPGAHTWLAAGVEGLAPYWFDVEVTGYLGDDGRLSARLKASQDLRLTNRLVLTPQGETNLYSRSEKARGVGDGVSNVELGIRLRYVMSRRFAPYVGYVWDRSLGATADLKRADGDAAMDRRFVAGVRLLW
ncbi:copper resistance protein B [Phenylobacterium haematophilum]|uniref:Copper resistance protein B n=2 Tax=Phenylobacterium haematophilum TaxID=98513 RepID=A0A840A6G3_9CAUL|nr:copper resistance protein B [Phenylobacterium haematophilum]